MAGMVPEDLYELTWADDPRVSPDGSLVAFTVTRLDEATNDYRSAVWLAAADGSSPPRAFTAGAKRDAMPRWSPDGTRLSFVSTRDSDHAQLYVIPASGGEPRRLTDLRASVEAAVWSPDGARIAIAARVPDAGYDEEDLRRRRPRRIRRLRFKLDDVGWVCDRRRHVFVVDVEDGGEPVQLTSGDADHGAPAWSPDGAMLAVCAARHEDWDLEPFPDLYVVAAGGGEPRRLTTDGEGSYAKPSWGPGGSRIAVLWTPGRFDDPRHTRVAVVDAQTGERTVLTEQLDRTCDPYPSPREPAWSGDRLLFAVEDAGNVHLHHVAASGGIAPEALVRGELRVTGWDAAGGTVAYAATTATRPSEIFVGDRRISSASDAFTARRALVAPERFTAVSKDGAEVDAWIVRPAAFDDAERYPALLCIHGGPFTSYGNGFFDEFQVYAGAGYVVIFSNPRGSSGSTEAWGRAIRGPSSGGPGMGTVDHEDLTAVVDTALERFPFVDPERLGVLGGSYGGYMTSWIVSHTDRFKAACSERAVNQWFSMFGSSDEGWTFRGYIGSDQFDDPEAWLAMSPATYAKDIRTPMLILHSEDDLRCPVEQAEQLFTALRLLRRDVEMVRFPAEGHEMSRSGSPAHRVMRFDVILGFFEQHLRP